MAKKQSKPRAQSLDQIELRRWCIQMAMSWPVVSTSYTYSGAVGFPQLPKEATARDADVIGRADKLLNWVNSSD